MKHYTITTQPTREPITAQEAADFLRIGCSDAELAALTGFIASAREAVENFTGRALMLSGWLLVAEGWTGGEVSWCGDVMTIDRTPLVDVVSVEYYAEGETSLTTLDPDEYIVVTTTTPGRVVLLNDPPALAERPDAVQIEFTAGAESPGAIPPTLLQAVRLLTAHFYENRGNQGTADPTKIPEGLIHLLTSQRVGGFVA